MKNAIVLSHIPMSYITFCGTVVTYSYITLHNFAAFQCFLICFPNIGFSERLAELGMVIFLKPKIYQYFFTGMNVDNLKTLKILINSRKLLCISEKCMLKHNLYSETKPFNDEIY